MNRDFEVSMFNISNHNMSNKFHNDDDVQIGNTFVLRAIIATQKSTGTGQDFVKCKCMLKR